jgi:XTP/dITP diphosphohydrolase
MDKLLQVLSNQSNRNAQFKTVVTSILRKQYLFTGIARGEITLSKVGKEGFWYDPIFQPDINKLSLNCRPKQISHRERQHNNSSVLKNEK